MMLDVKVMKRRWCWEVKFWNAARQLAAGRAGRGGWEAGKQDGWVRFRPAGGDGACRVKRLGKAWVELRRVRSRKRWVAVGDSIFSSCGL